jgi:carboxylesterase
MKQIIRIKETTYFYKVMIVFSILIILMISSCSSQLSQTISIKDPQQITDIKAIINATLDKPRTPETIYELAGEMNTYFELQKEAYKLREKSEPFLKMYYEHPSPKGVLLIHGLGASPNEMRELADLLEKEGYTVIGVRLAGHGEGLELLESTTWQDWYESVEYDYALLDYLTDETYVVGISTGSSLALVLASEKEFDGLITIAPAIVMKDWKLNFISLFKHFKRYSQREHLNDEEKITYDAAVPTESAYQLMKLIDIAKQRFGKVEEPILIMQATNDPRVKKESAQFVYNNVASADKELLWFESDKHVITSGPEKEKVFKEVIGFLEK